LFPSVYAGCSAITKQHAAPQYAPKRRRAANDPHNAPPPSTFERLSAPPPSHIRNARRDYKRTNEPPNNSLKKDQKKIVEKVSRRVSNVRQTFVPLRAQI